ncbi:MAG: hypothetical protein ACI9DQ_001337, partial [Glaciecola sp.]
MFPFHLGQFCKGSSAMDYSPILTFVNDNLQKGFELLSST